MKRLRVGEVMDQPGLDPAAHAHALTSLNRANRMLGIDRRLWRAARDGGGLVCSVLDIGCGGGGFLAFVRANNGGNAAGRLIGLDVSSVALAFARERQPGIHWVAGEAKRLPLADRSVDVVTCSLFLHHFDEPDAITILREAARVARRAVIVGELVRSSLAWTLTYLTTRTLSRSWIFHVDGPRSVRAAFRAGELRALAGQAGLEPVKIRRCFPLRYLMIWHKPGGGCATK